MTTTYNIGNLNVASNPLKVSELSRIKVYEFLRDSRFAIYKIELFKVLTRNNKFVDLLEYFEGIDTYDINKESSISWGKQALQLIGQRGNTMFSLYNALVSMKKW